MFLYVCYVLLYFRCINMYLRHMYAISLFQTSILYCNLMHPVRNFNTLVRILDNLLRSYSLMFEL